jgi:hypothetical protein
MIVIDPIGIMRGVKELISTIAEAVGLYEKLDSHADRHLVQTLGALKEDVRATTARLCAQLNELGMRYNAMGIDIDRPLKDIYTDYVSKMSALDRHRLNKLQKEFAATREELAAVVDSFASILICAERQQIFADAHHAAAKYRQLLGPIGADGNVSLAEAIKAMYEVANDVRNQLI